MATTESYALTVDKNIWRNKHARPTEFSTSLDLGHLTYTTMNVAGSDGINLPCVRLDVLDELCKDINATIHATDPSAVQIDSLYTSTLNLAEGPGSKARTEHFITFTRAALVVSFADKPETAKLGWSLTFKEKLNSNIVLPMVFSEIAISSEDHSLVASVFEFNSSMRGRLGSRHAAQLVPFDDFQPSTVINPAEDLDILNVQDLILLPGYTDEKLQSRVHEYINNAMLYHMKPLVRETILGQEERPKVHPGSLPKSMADELDQHAKDWFHDVYGPAFVSNAITKADPETLQQWSDKFGEQDRLKVRYWFSGRGESCLSHDRIYSRMTELANKQAMYTLVPGIRQFTYESQLWADKLDNVIRDPGVIRSLQRTKESGGVDYSNKIANLMRTLDVEQQHTHTQMETSLAGSVAEALQNPYLLKSSENTARVTKWVVQSIRHILTSVLGDGDYAESLEIDGALRDSILKDIGKFEQENNLNRKGSAIDRANAILHVLQDSGLLDRLSHNLSPLPEASGGDDSDEDDEDGDADDDKQAPVKTSWGTAVEGFDELWERQYDETFGASLRAVTAKGVVSLAYTAFKIKDAVNGFVDFQDGPRDEQPAPPSSTDPDDTTDVERVGMIFKTTKFVVTIVNSGPKIWNKIRDPAKLMRQLGRTWIVRKVAESSLAIKVGEQMASLATSIRVKLAEITFLPMALQRLVSRRISPHAVPSKLAWTAAKVSNPGGARDILRVASKAPVRIGAQRESQYVLNVARKSFGMADIALSTAAQVLGIAVVVTSALSLAREWDSMSDPARALNVISLTVSTLAVFTSEVFVGSILAALQVADATATAAVNAAPIVGQVLAIVGVVISIVLAIVSALVKPEAPPPPPDYVAEFIDGDLKGLLGQWNEQPPAQLDVNIDQETIPEKDKLGLFQVSVTNNSGNSRLRMERVTFTFKSGFKSASLFKNDLFTAISDHSDRNARDNGNVFVDQFSSENPCRVISTSSIESKGKNENDKSQNTYVHRIIVTGVPRDENMRGTLEFPARGMFRLNIAGIGRGDGISDFEVVEEYEDDSVYHNLDVKPRQ